jgi:hypothetical protein
MKKNAFLQYGWGKKGAFSVHNLRQPITTKRGIGIHIPSTQPTIDSLNNEHDHHQNPNALNV